MSRKNSTAGIPWMRLKNRQMLRIRTNSFDFRPTPLFNCQTEVLHAGYRQSVTQTKPYLYSGNHFMCLSDCSSSTHISSIKSVSTTMRSFNVTVHGLV